MKSQFERFSPEWWAWMTMPEPNTGCLIWMGSVCKNGYGRVAYRGKANAVLVHRIAYECANGPIGDGRHVCHRCDTPSCVNPDHLFLGTQKDNMRDMFEKGRGNPGGFKPAKMASLLRGVAEPVSRPPRENAVGIVDHLHHIRTNAMTAPWRRVIGVPAKRPTYAMVLVGSTPKQHPLPSTPPGEGLPTVATVAPCCAPLPPSGGEAA